MQNRKRTKLDPVPFNEDAYSGDIRPVIPI